jgi:23S rRNA U2552 (ribose-2'-O)-methylase RlmE/FtsJ
MSKATEYLKSGWTHSEDEKRIEDLCAYDMELASNLTRIALRFISEKGLSGEFADTLEEIGQDLEAVGVAEPDPSIDISM